MRAPRLTAPSGIGLGVWANYTPPAAPPPPPNGDSPFAVGVWTNISPAGVPFVTSSFTQGMSVDFLNPGTIYCCITAAEGAGTSLKGIWKTTDYGANWVRNDDLDSPIRVKVDPSNSNRVYCVDGVAGSTFGFWRSLDGGSTWALPPGWSANRTANNLTADLYHVEIDPADPAHLLVTAHSPWANAIYNGDSGIIESHDYGDTWTVIPPPRPGGGFQGGYNVFFVHDPQRGFGASNIWLFGTQGDGWYRSTNSGASWTKVSDVDMDHGAGQICFTDDGTLWASGNPSVLRSTDLGATWTEHTPDPFAGFLSIETDGVHVYSSKHFGGAMRRANSNLPNAWSDVGTTPSEFSGSGAFEMIYDRTRHILYSAHTGAGIWARRLA